MVFTLKENIKTVKIKALKPGKPAIVKIIIPKSFKKSKKAVYTTYTNATTVKTNSKPWIIIFTINSIIYLFYLII